MTASAPLMFNKKDVRKLFQDKKVIFLGDSIMRDIYKDFIWLYDRGTLISHEKIVDTNDKEANTVQRRLTGTERLVPDTGLLTRGHITLPDQAVLCSVCRARLPRGERVSRDQGPPHPLEVLLPHQVLERPPQAVPAQGEEGGQGPGPHCRPQLPLGHQQVRREL